MESRAVYGYDKVIGCEEALMASLLKKIVIVAKHTTSFHLNGGVFQIKSSEVLQPSPRSIKPINNNVWGVCDTQ